jgi:REP element-mobilizing transposase RayT
MAWKLRVRGEELYHHVYAWGNDRHPIFKDRSHYIKYLSLLENKANEHAVDIIAYALMEWHVHLFIYDHNNSMANFMMSLHGEYAQYFNLDLNRTGHVFGERYNNKIVANTIYAKWLSRYIHRQALEAGLTDDPTRYPWTSYNRYLGIEPRGFIKNNVVLDMFEPETGGPSRYREFVMDSEEGPIDWGHRMLKVRSRGYFIDLAAQQLKTRTEKLTSPHGRLDRKLRGKAIRLFKKDYGLNNVQIAMIMGVTHTTIANVLRKEEGL